MQRKKMCSFQNTQQSSNWASHKVSHFSHESRIMQLNRSQSRRGQLYLIRRAQTWISDYGTQRALPVRRGYRGYVALLSTWAFVLTQRKTPSALASITVCFLHGLPPTKISARLQAVAPKLRACSTDGSQGSDIRNAGIKLSPERINDVLPATLHFAPAAWLEVQILPSISALSCDN